VKWKSRRKVYVTVEKKKKSMKAFATGKYHEKRKKIWGGNRSTKEGEISGRGAKEGTGMKKGWCRNKNGRCGKEGEESDTIYRTIRQKKSLHT